MNIAYALKKLHSDRQFKDWHRKNPDSYLSHVFLMSGGGEEAAQVGYHNSKSDLVTTFEIADPIVINPAEKAFKKPGSDVYRIDLSLVKVDLAHALEQACRLQREKYPKELPLKKIVILQKLDQYGLVYNITFVTASFKTLNIKIDAGSGSTVYDNIVSIMEFPANSG